ncbi:MAG: hypothetical protein SNJ52_05280, partial [Verrucomicrobiia bacterium]
YLFSIDAKRTGFSWLFAFGFYFTLGLGSLFWVMLHHATNSSWSVVVRRQMENVAALLPFIFVFSIPIILLRHDLFKWMKLSPGMDPLLDNKAAFLNEPFFLIRMGLYLVLFGGLAVVLRAFSIRQDRDGDPRWTIRSQGITFGFLLPFALILTAAVIDWFMALDFHWFSTMWGVYLFSGSALNSMALLILIITALRSKGYLERVVTIEHYHIMGKLLFAFTVFWAYIAFSQYFLIWYANIPEETVYFLRRNTSSWWYLSILLVVGHFFAPFLFLIGRWAKKSPFFLSLAAGWTLLMHLVDLYIIVLPTYSSAANPGIDFRLSDLVALVAIGAPLAAIFIARLSGPALYPLKDPRLQESLGTRN